MGRKPIGRKAMTPTQRTLLWRARKAEAAAKTAKVAARATRLAVLADVAAKATAVLAALGKLYSVIYADPPWDPSVYGDKGKSRHPSRQYAVMATDAIAAIKVPAAPACVLFMWCTVQMLEHGLRVMRAWGFDYKSAYFWHKPGIGHGYWSMREPVEILLIGTRGAVPAPLPGLQPPQLTSEKRGVHSTKPAAFHEYIEAMFPEVPRLEMFWRPPARPGWDVWPPADSDYAKPATRRRASVPAA